MKINLLIYLSYVFASINGQDQSRTRKIGEFLIFFYYQNIYNCHVIMLLL
jgi:hypothetical protein